jgi:hypothetical protein
MVLTDSGAEVGAALSMSGSTLVVVTDALPLRRVKMGGKEAASHEVRKPMAR